MASEDINCKVKVILDANNINNGNDNVKINFLLLNCQSLSVAKADAVAVNYIDESLKLICITESWLLPDALRVIYFPSFKLCSSFSRTTMRGGGTAIWGKNNLSVKPIILDSFCMEGIFESCGIRWKVADDKSMVIILVYRSPHSSKDCLSIFFDKLYDVLEYVFEVGVDIVVMGDFNIDPKRDSSEFTVLSNILTSFNLENIVQVPTRGKYILDHVYISSFNLNKCDVSVMDNTISDHKTVLVSVPGKSKKTSTTTSFSRTFHESDINMFKQKLVNETWNDVFVHKDIDSSFSTFYNIFLYYFNLYFPLRKRIRKKCGRGWINAEITSSSNNLKNLFCLKLKYPALTDAYRNAKNEHNLLVNSTKYNYYQKRIIEADNPSRAAWSLIRELSHRSHADTNIEIVREGNTITEPLAVANAFNDYFRDAPVQNMQELASHGRTMEDFIGNSSGRTIFLEPMTFEEVSNIIKYKIKYKASSGPDNIPPYLIKQIHTAIVPILTYLINLSFLQGKFPDHLKVARLIPVPKASDSSEMGNYRPVSITSCFAKIYEYSFMSRLQRFLDKCEILHVKQHGFRSGSSTRTAISAFYGCLINFLEDGEYPIAVYLDLSKAFDCVCHELLFDKLEKYGIRGVALSWIKSFISDRYQFVSIKHYVNNIVREYASDTQSISVGVPQGSILGPLLFILFINDIISVPGQDAYMTLYADDIALLISDRNESLVKQKCNDVATNIYNWCCLNKLYINASKTNFMRFHPYQFTPEDSFYVDININNSSISPVSSFKFLGIFLDELLNWRTHCQYIIKRLNSLCYLFRNIKSVLDLGQLVNMYHAHVSSRLRYGVIFWGSSSLANDVFIAQKRIIRTMAGLRTRDSCKPFFLSAKIMTLRSILIFELAVIIHESKSHLPIHRDFHEYNTRSKDNLVTPLLRLTISQKSPEALGIKIYNKLPLSYRSLNMTQFKRQLHTLLVDNCFYCLNEFFCFQFT